MDDKESSVKDDSVSKTDDDSSTDDFGLRRRFVSSRRTEESKRDAEPTTSLSEEKVKRIQPGAESRKILDPEDPVRGQPVMMKKKKKKRKSEAPRTQDAEKPRKKEKKGFGRMDFFLSGDDVRDPQQDSYVIFVMRDFVIYFIFMVVTSVAIFGSFGQAENYFANVLADIVVKSKFVDKHSIEMTFYDIKHRQQMWAFINDIVLKLIYESTIHSGEMRFSDGFTINSETILFGAPQIRQLRVKGGTCESIPLFQGVFDDCADYYSEAIEDTRTFGLNTSAWIYQPPTPDHVPVVGVFSTYGGGGFSMNFGRTENFTRNWLLELDKGEWIRFGTRAVIVDFNLFNPNTQLFCAVKLVFEMPPLSGIVPKAYFTTVRLIWFSGSWGFFLVSCHIAFGAFVAFYTYEELSQMIRLKFVYLWNWWNALDLSILLCSYVTLVFSIMSFISGRNFLERHYDALRTYGHVSLDYMVYIQSRYHISVALLAFFVWAKVLKFSTLNRTVTLVLASLAKVRSELVAATVMLFVLIFGFAILGMCVSGHLYLQLSAIGPSIFTHVGLFGGGIHFFFAHKLVEVVFRTWLLLYIIVVMVVYLNIYVALIVHGFEMAQIEMDDLTTKSRFGDVLREFFCRFLLWIRSPSIVENIYEREKEMQNIRVYRHLASILSRHGFNMREIGLIFAKHKVRYGENIPIETLSDIYEEMNVRNKLFVETEGHNQIAEQLEKVSRNVEHLDQTIVSVMTKVDTLTNKYLKGNAKKFS